MCLYRSYVLVSEKEDSSRNYSYVLGNGVNSFLNSFFNSWFFYGFTRYLCISQTFSLIKTKINEKALEKSFAQNKTKAACSYFFSDKSNFYIAIQIEFLEGQKNT